MHFHTVHTLPTTAQLSHSAWSAEPKIFAIWPFAEPVCQGLMSSVNSLSTDYLPSATKRVVIEAKSLSFSGSKCCETAVQDMGQRMRATLLLGSSDVISLKQGHLKRPRKRERAVQGKEFPEKASRVAGQWPLSTGSQSTRPSPERHSTRSVQVPS